MLKSADSVLTYHWTGAHQDISAACGMRSELTTDVSLLPPTDAQHLVSNSLHHQLTIVLQYYIQQNILLTYTKNMLIKVRN